MSHVDTAAYKGKRFKVEEDLEFKYFLKPTKYFNILTSLVLTIFLFLKVSLKGKPLLIQKIQRLY